MNVRYLKKIIHSVLSLSVLLICLTACGDGHSARDLEAPALGATPYGLGGGDSGGGPDGFTGAGSITFNDDGSAIYHSYAGPVFQLSVLGETSGLSATRNTVFDFSPRSVPDGRFSHSDIVICDSYTLTNNTENDIKARVLYPFNGCFTDLSRLLPTITAGGVKLETTLHAGAYSGGFMSWDGTDSPAANPKPLNTWQGYEALLSDGAYARRALEAASELDQMVTVYEFSNARNNSSQAAVAPTLAACFRYDERKTTVLPYMFNGGETDDGYMRLSFFIPEEWRFHYDRSYYMLVFGEDISDLVIQGYKNGGCHEGEELDGVTADVSRYERTYGDILAVLLDDFMAYYHDGHVIITDDRSYTEPIDMAALYKATVDHMFDYGILSENIAWMYTVGMGFYDFLVDVIGLDRVFYLDADIVVPAGGSIELRVDMNKPGSFNHFGFSYGAEDRPTYGYDMLIMQGANLLYDSMAAEAICIENTGIFGQNFGFGQDSAAESMALDLNVPHYYIDLRLRGG